MIDKKGQITDQILKQDVKTASHLIRAVSHPVRLLIIELLDERVKLNVTDIQTSLKLKQPVTSHHLAILKKARLLKADREGKQIYYSLQHDRITKMISCIREFNLN